MTREHVTATAAESHPSKSTNFTGDPSLFVPIEAGLFYTRTDVSPNQLFRSTGPNAGNLVEVGGSSGSTPTVTEGTVTASSLPAGQTPTVSITNTGSTTAAVFDFNFQIPAGESGITNIDNDFTQPTAGSTVNVLVDSSSGLAVGLFVSRGTQIYEVTAIAGTTVTLRNPTGVGNSPAGTLILAGVLSPTGRPGQDGVDGLDGAAATVAVGSTTTSASGTNAAVTNTGTINSAILNFSIPRGASSIATTTAAYTQPAIAATVTVAVDSSAGFDPNIVVVINGNYYFVTAIPSATSITVENSIDFASDNTAPGNTVNSGAKVIVGGRRGQDGLASGVLTRNAVLGLGGNQNFTGSQTTQIAVNTLKSGDATLFNPATSQFLRSGQHTIAGVVQTLNPGVSRNNEIEEFEVFIRFDGTSVISSGIHNWNNAGFNGPGVPIFYSGNINAGQVLAIAIRTWDGNLLRVYQTSDVQTSLNLTYFQDSTVDSLTEQPRNSSITLALADNFKTITVNAASATTLTLPPNATTPFPIGSRMLVGRRGAGSVAIAPAAGVTLNGGTANFTLSTQWQMVNLWKYGTDAWWVF